MQKLNRKGYMLIEIIMAFVLTFGIAFFITELVINLKNKNDDLLVLSKVKTEQAIIYNKLNTLLKSDDIEFDCSKLKVNNNVITYDGKIITEVSDYVILKEEKLHCNKVEEDKNKYIKVNIEMDVPQIPTEVFDINLQYSSKYDVVFYGCGSNNGFLPFKFNYTGRCEVVNTDLNNWKIRFLSSGELEIGEDINIDIFLVGGGGGGGAGNGTSNCNTGGGGGGYTNTYKNKIVNKGKYYIQVGNGGNKGKNGEQSFFVNNTTYVANGGKTPTECSPAVNICGRYWHDGQSRGGDGGSGGGNGMQGSTKYYVGVGMSQCSAATAALFGGDGGSNGGLGLTGHWEEKTSQAGCKNYANWSGNGQGRTTREFGESSGQLYSGGGGGKGGVCDQVSYTKAADGAGGAGGGGNGGSKGGTNTGGGGGYNAAGGSGIVIFRNKR